jgi:putative ABC transport system ATP-binding protein
MALRSLYEEPERAPEEIDWPALECHDVFKIFRSGPAETVALRGLDLRIEPGDVVAIFGPSGSGKSTLMSLAAGLDRPSAGEVRAFGRSLSALSENDLAAYRARDVAVIFQSDNLWPSLTVAENVTTSLRLAGGNAKPDRAESVLSSFGLAQRAHHRAAALSGGEQQRAAVAVAAARRARIVLADEPTGELDERNEGIVLEALLSLRDEVGSTVVIVTHSERVAGEVDRVIELRDGKVLG